MTTNSDSGTVSGSSVRPVRQRGKKFVAPSVKYEIFLQLMRDETTVSRAAESAGVDRSVIVKLRQVAKEGATSALSSSRPGSGKTVRDIELEDAHESPWVSWRLLSFETSMEGEFKG
ncbi:MAG: hypothetical protein WBA45_08830 [Microthrixaceae bacterium]